jgi:4-diphosphocytidyl-2-C-methyl-D-erythritol kinase
LIVKPAVHVSTAAAFAGIKPLFRENSIDEFTSLSIQQWRKELHNDFENSVFELYPDILEIKNLLYRQGAIYAALSGSGSAVFGLFEAKPVNADFSGCEVFQALLGSHL